VIEPFKGKHPQIHPEAFVHAAASLIGDIEIGAQSSIWPNVTLRGDDGPIIIGSQTSIQDNSCIHCTEGMSKTTIGNRVTVGHSVVLHGCTIGDDALIGMGAIILDNAVVESGAMVAAGALITPGKIVRAGTLVAGNPMRILRELAERDLAMIQFSWRAYVERTREYLAARG